MQVAPLDETASVRVSSGAGVAVGDEGVDPPLTVKGIVTLEEIQEGFDAEVLTMTFPVDEPTVITALVGYKIVALEVVYPDGTVIATVPKLGLPTLIVTVSPGEAVTPGVIDIGVEL